MSRGHFICLYAGEFISQAQAHQRFLKQEAEGVGNYMLCMRENNAVIGFVDPTFVGNIGQVAAYWRASAERSFCYGASLGDF
jgi:hypothetical protein